MTTSTLIALKDHYSERKFLLAGLLISISLFLLMLAFEFHYQYLHNPAVHIFFQEKGIFLF